MVILLIVDFLSLLTLELNHLTIRETQENPLFDPNYGLDISLTTHVLVENSWISWIDNLDDSICQTEKELIVMLWSTYHA
jgi:hypothetical protein